MTLNCDYLSFNVLYKYNSDGLYHLLQPPKKIKNSKDKDIVDSRIKKNEEISIKYLIPIKWIYKFFESKIFNMEKINQLIYIIKNDEAILKKNLS